MTIDSNDPNLSADPGETASATAASAILATAGSAPARVRGRADREPMGDEAAGMSPEARRRIGRNLRLLYAEVLNQPLPERFGALLADLAARSETRGSS
ncbi:NepR family anti-sigma factor [Methylobacterium sp. J-068]|uniref:NepR family anti-sigma factor n=1 Tax=Methylobacterium sp. J-068 TaxID=2836649 RepID=UPI001FBB2549|nr:NepR family anti-sigma factor [Methylobacterium sp. J-068]MCJ2037026.1 hypothetical protein [Methylobacterium sp. J-068]